MIRDSKHNVQPTFVDTILGVPIDLITKGKTETHDPIGDYVRKDPLGTLLQIPAEAALWITGGKAIQAGAKGAKAVSPVKYIAPKVDDVTAYSGLAVKGKPIIGVQQKSVVVGHDPKKIPLEKVKLESRSGGELALGRGGEREIFYSDKTLDFMKDTGFISELSAKRAKTAVKLEKATQAKGEPFVGDIGKGGFKKISEEQGDFLLRKTELLQRKGEIETLHGSIATRVNIEQSLRGLSGDVLKMGDLDIVPKASKDIGFEARASKLIKEYYDEFPLGKGESKSFKDVAGSNRELILTKADGKKEKIFEVVVKDSDEMVLGTSKKDPTKILDYKIPFDKKVKAVDYNIETKNLAYQQLTQTKTVLAFQKSPDASAKAIVYPARGRDKDIVRRYWQARQTELNQIRGGQPLKAKETRKIADEFKSLYPELDFSTIPDEKVVINLSSKVGSSTLTPSSKGSASSLAESTLSQKGSSTILRPKSQSNFSKAFEQSNKTKSTLTDSVIQKTPSSKIQKPSNNLQSFRSKITQQRENIRNSIVAPRSRIVSSKNPSIKTPSLFSSSSAKMPVPKAVSPITRIIGTRTDTIVTKPTKGKKPIGLFLDAVNTTKKKSGKVKYRRDFLGSSRTDHIVGLFKRPEILEEKKRFSTKLNRQVRIDKTKSLKSSKVFGSSSIKNNRLRI